MSKAAALEALNKELVYSILTPAGALADEHSIVNGAHSLGHLLVLQIGRLINEKVLRDYVPRISDHYSERIETQPLLRFTVRSNMLGTRSVHHRMERCAECLHRFGLIALQGQIARQIDLACDEIVPPLTRHLGILTSFAHGVRVRHPLLLTVPKGIGIITGLLEAGDIRGAAHSPKPIQHRMVNAWWPEPGRIGHSRWRVVRIRIGIGTPAAKVKRVGGW